MIVRVVENKCGCSLLLVPILEEIAKNAVLMTTGGFITRNTKRFVENSNNGMIANLLS